MKMVGPDVETGRREARLTPRQRAVALGLLIVIGLLGGLTGAEAINRRAARQRTGYHLIADPVLHHRLRANWRREYFGYPFETNSLGLPDREYPQAKPTGVVRIVMLGDSFTEAGRMPLARTPARRTEAVLNDHGCACRFEVVNAGTSGYSPILEYLQLKQIASRLSPDLVVLNFDMTDVHEDFVRTHLATFDANGVPIAVNADRRIEASLLMPPLPKPAALRFVNPAERVLNRLSLYQEFRRSALGRRWFGSLNLSPEDLEARGLIGNLWYDRMAPTRDLDSAEIRAAWAATSRYIVDIRDLARQHDSGFALVTYPHAHQVSTTASPIGRRQLGIGEGFFGSERPFQILEALGRQEDFAVINLVRSFRERATSGAQLFRVDDFHHTADGAALLGEGIAGGLLEKGVVTCRPVCVITGARRRR